MKSERSDNTGFKSSLVKLPLDPSKNSLLSTDLGKKTGDKKTNEFKQSNNFSNNRKKLKSFENDSIFEAYEEETEKKKKIKDKDKEDKKFNKIIVDDIENIYSCLDNKFSKRYSIQNVVLLTIPFFTTLCHWIFLFLTKSKLENNYCFSDLNQLDICLESQVCDNLGGKISLIIYNDTFDIRDKSLSESELLLEEMKAINLNNKELFMQYYYRITKDKLLSSVDTVKYVEDKTRFAVILTKKEKWNIFLLFSNMCLKENINLYLLIIIIVGGAIGSIVFSLLADIYGRRKIIIVLLFLLIFGFSFLIVITFFIKNKQNILTKQSKNMAYHDEAYNKVHQIGIMNTQIEIANYLEKIVPLYLVSLLVLSVALRPLSKISLSLLLENSISDLNALQNFRKYNFVTTAVPHFFAFIILVLLNNFYIFLIVFDAFFFILLILTIIFVNESMRYHYEYCEWNDLTNELNSMFKITEDLPLVFKNNIEYEAFRIEENRQMNGNYLKRVNSIFEYVKQRITYLKRDIRRNSSFIIKKEEVKFNPLIILTSLSANRIFNRLRFLLLIILFIINIQIFFVERELVEAPFLKVKDLYLDLHHNYIINSNYFILMIFALISNFVYYMFYRISCFKLVFYPSVVLLTIALIVYHILSKQGSEIPINLNLNSFEMIDEHKKQNLSNKIIVWLIISYFFLIGINFYMNIIITKITKTLYRCSLFGIVSLLEVLAFAFGETLKYQIDHCFLLIANNGQFDI